MLEAPHYSATGAKKRTGFALPGDFFDGAVNQPAMHQAVKVFLNNQRQGTAATKTRSFVSGGNQKPWRQKGTGRARQGSIRAPHWRGGGTVFGPSPRDYRTDIPRKLKQLARRSALNARAAGDGLVVVEPLDFPEPKTARLVELVRKLGAEGRNVLVLTHGVKPTVYLSGRNIQTVRVMSYGDASAYDVLWAGLVVVEEGAFSGEPPVVVAGTEAPAAAPARKAPAAKRSTAKAEAPRAKAGAKKRAAAPKGAAAKGAPKAKKPAPRKKKGDK
jgi:large subunit ribosomal protein L4